MNGDTPEVIDADVADEAPNTLPMRHPGTPVTLEQLAALKGEAVEIVEARVQVLQTLRRAAIRATSPEDWLLFKAPDDQGGQIVGYLQDCGCDRVRDLYGIEIADVTMPIKVPGNDAGEFHYLISGSGRCRLTRQVVESIEGGRSSTDDFCKYKRGAELEIAVRKAARANLDGNIVRELSGLASVPVDELREAWSGTRKDIANCRHGRGFGTQAERKGGNVRTQGTPTDVKPPICEKDGCGKDMRFVPGGVSKTSGKSYDAFWSCPEFKKVNGQGNGHSSIDDAAYRKQLADAQAANREPGQEG